MMLLEFDMDSDPAGKGGPASSVQNSGYSGGANPIVLYDGVCGLCNRTVQFALKRDRAGIFRFASLQSGLASRILARHGKDASDLDTVYVVLDYDPANLEKGGERLLVRSDAVLYILRRLGGFWGALGSLLRWIPRPIRDWGYGIVARIRYQVFGKYDTCPIPSVETRARFLDL
jgi:predicted DCC family thiol-disulfide oxidoreductase YuxK